MPKVAVGIAPMMEKLHSWGLPQRTAGVTIDAAAEVAAQLAQMKAATNDLQDT